jgi:hypothetical protein
LSIHHISSDLKSGCFATEAGDAIAYWWYKSQSKRLTVQVGKSRTSLLLLDYKVEAVHPTLLVWHFVDIAYTLANWLNAGLGTCTFSHKVIPPAGVTRMEIG